MAKTDNLIDYLTDIADAIREKKGTSDLINAQNFADEIKNMTTAGGGEGDGGSGVEYFVYDGSNMAAIMLSILSIYTKVRASIDGGTPFILVGPSYGVRASLPSSITTTEIAFGVDLNARMSEEGSPETLFTIKEYVLSKGVTEEDIAALPRITEEEFYNLNA